MSEIKEIIAIDTQRNGSGGTPFLTAIVDYQDGNSIERLSISFAYSLDEVTGEMNGYAKDDDGLAICFVLNLEGMFEETLKHHYRGDYFAHKYAAELIAAYQKHAAIKYGW